MTSYITQTRVAQNIRIVVQLFVFRVSVLTITEQKFTSSCHLTQNNGVIHDATW